MSEELRDKRFAVQWFLNIPLGDNVDPPAEFFDITLADYDQRYPPIMDVHGENIMVHGPINVIELARRRKVRLVQVEFRALDSTRVMTSEFGIQGDNQIIRLVTQLGSFDTLDHDLLPVNDDEMLTLMRNARGSKEAWDVIA
jgi:hypothetical protein